MTKEQLIRIKKRYEGKYIPNLSTSDLNMTNTYNYNKYNLRNARFCEYCMNVRVRQYCSSCRY